MLTWPLTSSYDQMFKGTSLWSDEKLKVRYKDQDIPYNTIENFTKKFPFKQNGECWHNCQCQQIV